MTCVCCGAPLSWQSIDRLYNKDDMYLCPTTGQAISGFRHRTGGGYFKPPERTVSPKEDNFDYWDDGGVYWSGGIW